MYTCSHTCVYIHNVHLHPSIHSFMSSHTHNCVFSLYKGCGCLSQMPFISEGCFTQTNGQFFSFFLRKSWITWMSLKLDTFSQIFRVQLKWLQISPYSITILLPTNMASHPNSHWEAPKFNFNSHHQSENYKVFYTRAIDNLEALNIDAKEADDHHTGWKQLKMMFKGKDRQTLQSLIDKGTITPEIQRMHRLALDAIEATMKSEEHFWHFRDKFLSDVCQQ